MSFNDLPLDIKIKINLLLYEHTNPNISLSYEHNGNTIYQIPKYNEYGNKIYNVFDFLKPLLSIWRYQNRKKIKMYKGEKRNYN